MNLLKKARRNTYICEFQNIRDKNKVIKRGPWSFDNSLLFFQEPKGTTPLRRWNLGTTPFGFIFHQLPLVCFCRKYVIALANSIELLKESKNMRQNA